MTDVEISHDTTTKIVSLIVAIVVFACVLVPVCESMSDTGGGGGGGQTYTVTNDGPLFALTEGDSGTHTIFVERTDDDRYIDVYVDDVLTEHIPYIDSGNGNKYIGVYEASVLDGMLVSQPGRTPATGYTLAEFEQMAMENTVYDYTLYSTWTFTDWMIYKMLAGAITGSFDSQYMMGQGVVDSDAPAVTGLTTSAYQKSNGNNQSVSLLLENTWGSVGELLGNTVVNNGKLTTGNTFIAPTTHADVANSLMENIILPTGSGYYSTIYTDIDAFGIISAGKANAGIAGQGFNDGFIGSDGNGRSMVVGGDYNDGGSAGLYCVDYSNSWSDSSDNIGTRLVCYQYGDITSDYADVIISFDNTGIITDVECYDYVSRDYISGMPNGTTLNGFWDFDMMSGCGPFGVCYNAFNLYDGPNADDAGEARWDTTKGGIAYVLDPNDLTKTMDGYTYDPTLYNIMMYVPTLYWEITMDSDTGAGQLHISNDTSAFSGYNYYSYPSLTSNKMTIGYGAGISTIGLPYVDGEEPPAPLLIDGCAYLYVSDNGYVQCDVCGTVTEGQYAGHDYFDYKSWQIDNSGYPRGIFSATIENGYITDERYGDVFPLTLYRSNTGTYAYTSSAKVSDTGRIYGFNEGNGATIPSEDLYDTVIIYGNGTVSNITDNIDMVGQVGAYVPDASALYKNISYRLDSESNGHYHTVSDITCEYDFDATDFGYGVFPCSVAINKFFVPATFTYSEGGSGSGSGGIDGPAGIIVGLIPVFVVLALLIYALNLLGIVNISRPEEIE